MYVSAIVGAYVIMYVYIFSGTNIKENKEKKNSAKIITFYSLKFVCT